MMGQRHVPSFFTIARKIDYVIVIIIIVINASIYNHSFMALWLLIHPPVNTDYVFFKEWI